MAARYNSSSNGDRLALTFARLSESENFPDDFRTPSTRSQCGRGNSALLRLSFVLLLLDNYGGGEKERRKEGKSERVRFRCESICRRV